MSTQEKKPKKWLFIAFLVISGLMITSLIRGINDLFGTRERFDKAEAEVAKLEVEKRALEQSLEEENGGLITEHAIRDKLGLAKPGEIVVILPEDIGETFINTETVNDQDIPNWKKWIKVFDF